MGKIKQKLLIGLLFISIVLSISNLQEVAAYSYTATKPYEYTEHGATLGWSAIYNYYGYVNCYADSWFVATAYAEVGDYNSFYSQYTFTVSAQVRLTAYMTAGWNGHANIRIWVIIKDATNQ